VQCGKSTFQLNLAPTEEHAVSEDEYATVAALYAVEHIGVNRIKPVLHLLPPARRHHATDTYIFRVGATRDVKQFVIRQWSLQRLGLHPMAPASKRRVLLPSSGSQAAIAA
jgi:hypothetical protein